MPDPRFDADDDDSDKVDWNALRQLSLFPDFSALDEEVVVTCDLEDVEVC